MRSCISWIGGKHYIADWIISHFDYSVDCYVELFGGAGHILFAKSPHITEIFNDLDGNLINFYKVLKTGSKRLIEELDQLPYSRQLFNEFKQEIEQGIQDDFERAVKWFYVIRNSFSGMWGAGWAYEFARKSSSASSYHSAIDLFPILHKRLKKVQIENRDYREIIKSIKESNQSQILLYADPPYVNTDYYKTGGKWTLEQHKELANLLNSLDCKIVLSYYTFKGIDEWYPSDKWTTYTKEVPKHSAKIKGKGAGVKPVATELLLTNFVNQHNLFDRR